jgi:hypothetical protein
MSRDIERAAGAGFSDWQRAARAVGNASLSRLIETMDPGDSKDRRNAHRSIHERLAALDLPRHHFVAMPCQEFLERPYDYLSNLPKGDYYFASIIPGVHLAHAATPEQVVAFVKASVARLPRLTNKELYVSHNGEPVMSSHIDIKNDGQPNTVVIEATIGNFNAFHRGQHTPEIIAWRDGNHRLAWSFKGPLETDDAWQTDELFACNGATQLSRIEMATLLFSALNHIPHDSDYYLPGYYEVLFERRDELSPRPVFIEAITDR